MSTAYGVTAVAALLSLAFAAAALRAKEISRVMAALALTGAGVAVAASGHAASAEPRWLMRPTVFAHVVCLSKCDRIAPEQIAEAETALRRWNDRARIVRLPFGLPELGELLRHESAEQRLAWDTASPGQDRSETAAGVPESTPHLHTRYRSVTWRFPVPVDRSAFEAYLSGLDPRAIVRAKGFVQFTQRPGELHVFQTVRGHSFIERFRGPQPPEPVAVLIGPRLDPAAEQERLRRLVFGNRSSLKLG